MGSRANSPFTIEEETWIVMKFAKEESISVVRRQFRTYFKVNPHKIPHKKQFSRVVERFQNTGNVKTQV